MELNIVGPSYQMDALSFGIQRSLNLYPLQTEVQGTKTITSLRSTPGYSLYATAGGGPIRGAISVARFNRSFVVSGTGFYEVNSDGTTTLHGTLNSSTGTVGVAENGLQVMVVDGTDGYIFTLASDTFTEISDPDFPGAVDVTFQDGYFLIIKPNSADVYISALNDGASWGALDYTTVQSNPDNLNSILSDNGNVWLGGKRSFEVYQNTGNASFPFERISGAVVQTGCAATFTLKQFDNTVVWLGVDEKGRGVVWRAEGYFARRISTQAIEKIIDSATDFTESYAWVYHEQGHIFYCLQVKGLSTTLVYDGSTGQWHERQFNGTSQHKGSCHFFFDNKNLIGDRLNGNIYEMSLGIYSDNGDEIQRERITPHFHQEKRMITHARLELDMEVGMGLIAGQGSDPQVMLQYSDDGGRTWSAELWESAGKLGDFSRRVMWNKLGSARDRVYKIRMSDPVFWQINGAYLNGT